MILPIDEDHLVACVACGLCLPHCPTYRVTGLEIASPRGRIAAMRAVQYDGAPIDDEFVSAMDACVQCRGCEAACPSSVPFGELMEGARQAIRPTRGRGRRVLESIGYRGVLPRHRVLMAGTWLALVAQRARLVPRRFGLPKLRAKSLRTPLPDDPNPDTYLFVGCVMDAWQREVHRDALRVMRAAGARPGLPRRGGDCCGALHTHAGRGEDARRLARRVMASMPGDAPIVVDSAGCGATMKEYGRLLGTDAAIAFSARVLDFSEWLAGRELPAPTAGRAGCSPSTVVVQDPCHLRHVQHAEQAVRTVLRPAYRLVETDDDGLCCGAGGAYGVLEPDLSGRVRDRKVAAIRAAAERAGGTGGFVVASTNPGCAMHLTAAGLRVRHPAELIAARLPESPAETRLPEQESEHE